MGRLATVVIAGAVAAGMVTVHPATLQPYQTVARGTPIDHVAVIGDSYTTGTDEGGWGTFRVTPNATVKSVQVRVFENGGNEARLTHTVNVS